MRASRASVVPTQARRFWSPACRSRDVANAQLLRIADSRCGQACTSPSADCRRGDGRRWQVKKSRALSPSRARAFGKRRPLAGIKPIVEQRVHAFSVSRVPAEERDFSPWHESARPDAGGATYLSQMTSAGRATARGQPCREQEDQGNRKGKPLPVPARDHRFGLS